MIDIIVYSTITWLLLKSLDVYVVSKLVGAGGKVIGIDMNDDQLAVAEKYKEDKEKPKPKRKHKEQENEQSQTV